MNREGKCRHFNGTMSECCEAGVNYKQLAGDGQGWALRLPCLAGLTAVVMVVCEKLSLPTAEEIAADEKAANERFERTMQARKAIVSFLGGPWKKGDAGSRGSITCPCCGTGRLQFTRSGYNGHIHARCTKADCVSWME